MVDPVRSAFEGSTIMLPIASIMPTRSFGKEQRKSAKAKVIATTMGKVGVVEPIVVKRMPGEGQTYLLLDGHARWFLAKEMGLTELPCLVALEDDPFTYNKRVSHLATIQEHHMIMRALERGVPEQRIADALGVDVARIKRQRTFLDGICPEAVEMLKDRQLSRGIFVVLKKMSSSRQVEAIELMASCGNFTSTYADALLAGTRQQDLAKPEKPKKVRGLSVEEMARMEREMTKVQGDFKAAEATYGDHMLELVVASGYVAKLLRNPQVERYLTTHHAEFLDQFRAIAASNTLDYAA